MYNCHPILVEHRKLWRDSANLEKESGINFKDPQYKNSFLHIFDYLDGCATMARACKESWREAAKDEVKEDEALHDFRRGLNGAGPYFDKLTLAQQYAVKNRPLIPRPRDYEDSVIRFNSYCGETDGAEMQAEINWFYGRAHEISEILNNPRIYDWIVAEFMDFILYQTGSQDIWFDIFHAMSIATGAIIKINSKSHDSSSQLMEMIFAVDMAQKARVNYQNAISIIPYQYDAYEALHPRIKSVFEDKVEIICWPNYKMEAANGDVVALATGNQIPLKDEVVIEES